MSGRHYFFAGGGTGGHIYPGLAIAEQVAARGGQDSVLFFCSRREIDARILSASGFEFLPLPAVGFGLNPVRALSFLLQLMKSYYFVKQVMMPFRANAVLIGTGGFVTAPAVLAARALKIPVYLVNVDSVPGKANKLLKGLAKKVFVQFAQTAEYFGRDRAEVTGCPLRADFLKPDAHKACSELALDEDKKVLLVTGASSGAANINNAMIAILHELNNFAGDWQVVHLTGVLHIDDVKQAIKGLDITYHAVDYYDDMASLLAAADVVVGRAGAVSIAEFAAAGKPAICLPYPYHKDRHQYKNAQTLVNAGAAVIVEDRPEAPTQTAQNLLGVLKELLGDEAKRAKMTTAAKGAGIPDAAKKISDLVNC